MAGRSLVRRAAILATLTTPLSVYASGAGQNPRRLTLVTGEMREIGFPEGADLDVSRRGVVDLFHAGGGVWHVTALRAGFVIVDAKDASSGETVADRFFITVLRKGDDKPGAAVQPESTIPRWICETRGITCDQDAGLVTGRTASYQWYERAKHACPGNDSCALAVQLDDSARAKWAEVLGAKLGSDYRVEARAAGPLVAATFCGQNGRQKREHEADALTDGAVESGRLVLLCREDAKAARYRLAARVFLVEAGAATQLGFDGRADLALAAPPAAAAGSLMTRLRALQAERRAQIVGEPAFRLVANERAKVVSGGEFQVEDDDNDDDDGPSASWKTYGLQLSVEASPLDRARARLDFEISLSSRAAGSTPSLNLNALTSSVDLTLGAPVVVGLIDLKTKGRVEDETPILARLPIVGPLFQLGTDESSSSRLLVWLDLRDDESTEPLRSRGTTAN